MTGVAFSPDGNLIAGAAASKAWVWRVADGELLQTFEGQMLGRLAFIEDGARLLGLDKSGNHVHVWDVINGKRLRTIDFEGQSMLLEMAVSPDESIVIVGDHDGRIRLRRLADGLPLPSFGGHSAAVHGLAFRKDGKVLASASEDGSVRLWGPPDVADEVAGK